MTSSNWQQQIRRGVPLENPGQSVLDAADAAVLMAFTDDPIPELLLTQRASHLLNHAGEVAFPGGKRDPGDADIFSTALRESEEEVDLQPALVEVVGPLPTSVSKQGLKVLPVVGIIPSDVRLIPSESEIDSIFRVPLDYFLAGPPPDTLVREYFGQHYQLPCYRFDQYEIWGLTAYMIMDCCNRVFATDFKMAAPKPVK